MLVKLTEVGVAVVLRVVRMNDVLGGLLAPAVRRGQVGAERDEVQECEVAASGSPRASWARVRATELGHDRVVPIDWKHGLVTECIGVVLLADFLATGVMLRTAMVVITGGERFDTGCPLWTTPGRVAVRETVETGGKGTYTNLRRYRR